MNRLRFDAMRTALRSIKNKEVSTMKLRKLAIFVLALVMALPLIASAETAYPETVKFAAIYGFTGSNATTANYNQEAIDFMVDYINDNGGIASMNGAKIEVVYGDNTSDTTVCVTVADRVFLTKASCLLWAPAPAPCFCPCCPAWKNIRCPFSQTTPRIPSPSRAIGMSSAAISRAPRKPVTRRISSTG